MKCRNCPQLSVEHSFYWMEQEPRSMHRYRVHCLMCRQFVKWGTQAQCDEDIARDNGSVVNEYSPPSTLEAFFE